MIAYRGPVLIAEPELRWPIVILAAAITALLAILTAGLYYMAGPKSGVNSYIEQRLEGALQTGQPEFEEFRRQIAVEELVGTEKVHPLDNLAVAMTATVRNNTGRNISGLELRGAILDSTKASVRERTVVLIPRRQKILEPGEAINTRILLDGIDKDSDRAHLVLEVTAIRFDES
ncbi:MAG TPA: hypothetical protein VJT69_13375 [Pyrinomonadaceae bacterium]|nr:hypothetical protein [Pyrinomonadaceae bacterium]